MHTKNYYRQFRDKTRLEIKPGASDSMLDLEA